MGKFGLVAFFLVCVSVSVLTLEISPKIDFDSFEQSSDSSLIESDPLAASEGTDSDSSQRDSRAINAKGTIIVKFSNPLISIPSRKMPRTVPPNGVKNVLVVVNEQGITITGPGRIDCKENICYMVITDTDMMGNVVSSLQLTVVAKIARMRVNDVPVIDGVRGTGYNPYGSNSARPQNFGYRVPQVPVMYRPTMKCNRPKHLSPPFTNDYGGWTPIVPNPSPVDDKIEAPLSRTNVENEEPI